MKSKLVLGPMKWLRWVIIPAVVSVALLDVSPAFAQGAADPVAELTRGLNTVWVLITAFLVFWMQAGFAFVEAGMTRGKNTTNILFKNLIDFVFATLAFWAFGYAFMFGASLGGFIGTSSFFASGGADMAGIPMLAFWFFQLVFAGTAATIVSGSMAERTKFSAYLIYSFFISAVIYPISGHWIWGGGWLANLPFGAGFKDFAGSTVVHSVGGWLALVGAMTLGPRIGRFGKDGKPRTIPGHSISLVVLGVFILWLGWFGFNPGSQLAANGANADVIALVAVTTNIAAAAGGLTAMILCWLFVAKKPDLGTTLNGVLAGLVAITASCAWVTPAASIVIGAIGGAIVVFGAVLLEKLKIDDPVSAVPVHLMNGVWGTLAVGIFATENGVTGLLAGNGAQLIAQLIGVGAVAGWCIVMGVILFPVIIKNTVGLRVSQHEEMIGLDIEEHGTKAYPGDIVGSLGLAD